MRRFFPAFVVVFLSAFFLFVGQSHAQKKDPGNEKRIAEIKEEIADLQDKISILSAELAKLQPDLRDPAKREIDKLQGSWDNKSAKVEYFFKGNNFTVLIGGQPAIKGTYKLDVTKTPKRIDFTIDYLVGDPKSKGKVSPCIYELDEDGFRLCEPNGNATEPPKTFDIDPKDGVCSYFKRVKP